MAGTQPMHSRRLETGRLYRSIVTLALLPLQVGVLVKGARCCNRRSHVVSEISDKVFRRRRAKPDGVRHAFLLTGRWGTGAGGGTRLVLASFT